MKMSRSTTKVVTLSLALLLAALAALVLLAPWSSSAPPQRTAAGSASITPAAQTDTVCARCTADVVHTDGEPLHSHR